MSQPVSINEGLQIRKYEKIKLRSVEGSRRDGEDYLAAGGTKEEPGL